MLAKPTFEQALSDPTAFAVTWELVPGRGAFEPAQEAALAAAQAAAKGGLVHAVSITDNPGGGPALSAEATAAEVVRLGMEPLVHFTCKDRNRNQMESLLYGLERAGAHNLLVMSGDLPKEGWHGRAQPVYDLDPTMVLDLVADMNRGLEIATPKGPARLAPTHFLAGAVCSPFKATEAEQMGQYYKLRKKLESGARFIIAQFGFDARKYQELLMMVRHLGFGQVPVLGNIYLLPAAAARLMNRNGLPGCVVTDTLLGRVAEEAKAKDKGKSARLDRAAKLYAVLKGLGFRGTQIGGHGMTHDDLAQVIGKGEDLAPAWRDLLGEFDLPQPDGWYFFQRDPATGLNLDTPAPRRSPKAQVAYAGMRALHAAAFAPGGPGFKPLRALSRAVDGTRLAAPFRLFEHVSKVLSNDCYGCGDCALPDLAYLCPMSQCAKHQRNGPCGGSFEGWCEAFPGQRRCIYVLAYERLRTHGAEDQLGAYHLGPRNLNFANTSSWINYYLGRDHSAERLGIPPVPAPAEPPQPPKEVKPC